MEHGFFEAILAVKDVADIVVETGDASGFADLREDFSGALGSFEGAIVFAEENQRLDGAAEGASGFFPVAEGFVHFDGLFVMLDGGAIVSAGVKGVGFGASAEGDVFFAAQLAADQDRGFGEVQSFFCVYADLFEDQDRRVVLRPRCECSALWRVRNLRRSASFSRRANCERSSSRGDFFDGRGHQSNPNSPRCLRRRSMHFWRVKPIEPTARPSSAATSV